MSIRGYLTERRYRFTYLHVPFVVANKRKKTFGDGGEVIRSYSVYVLMYANEDCRRIICAGCLGNLFVSGGYLPTASILIILGNVFSAKNTPVVTRTFPPFFFGFVGDGLSGTCTLPVPPHLEHTVPRMWPLPWQEPQIV